MPIGEKLSEMNIKEALHEPANWSNVDKAGEAAVDKLTNPYREGLKELDHKMALEHNRVYEPVIWKMPSEAEGLTNEVADTIRVKVNEMEQIEKNRQEIKEARDA